MPSTTTPVASALASSPCDRAGAGTHAMTITDDPDHPRYLDEADVRNELSRVFDVCQGCRRCVTFCTSFPTLFDLLDRFDDGDAGRLTPAEQDRVLDECFHCARCSSHCPYTPELHELAVDVPRLVLRAQAMRHAAGQTPIRRRHTTRIIARTWMIGSIATAAAPLANAVIRARPGSVIRRLVATFTGVSAVRLLPTFASQRFSAWFARRTPQVSGRRQGAVTVYPTCIVEYQATGIGKDLVEVYERNGLECSLSRAGCCGAPWLHAGSLSRFRKIAARNVTTLAAEVRGGGDIVVAQSSCGRVLTQAYLDHVRGPDARLVADHTYDAAEYLMRVHTADGTALDTVFPGDVPERVVYHVAGHVRTDLGGCAGRDLITLTGAAVTPVEEASATDGLWGLRAGHEEVAIPIAERLASAIDAAGGRAAGTVVAGDSHLANTAIAEQTGITPVHPISLIARAYGIPPA